MKVSAPARKHEQSKQVDLWLTQTECQVLDLESFWKATHSVDDINEEAKLVFWMEKKQLRAPPPATPPDPLTRTPPMTFGANPRKKKKGREGKAEDVEGISLSHSNSPIRSTAAAHLPILATPFVCCGLPLVV